MFLKKKKKTFEKKKKKKKKVSLKIILTVFAIHPITANWTNAFYSAICGGCTSAPSETGIDRTAVQFAQNACEGRRTGAHPTNFRPENSKMKEPIAVLL
jgi:hypothetical protein